TGPCKEAHILHSIFTPIDPPAPVSWDLHGYLYRDGFPGKLPFGKLAFTDLQIEIRIRLFITFSHLHPGIRLHLIGCDLFPEIISVVALETGFKLSLGIVLSIFLLPGILISGKRKLSRSHIDPSITGKSSVITLYICFVHQLLY